MTDLVLIAGAFHGGWYWDPIVPALREAGHTVIAPTLPGLEEDYLPSVPVNLETHVQFVNDLIDSLDSDDVALVGHSYAGMVITGAAARAPERISSMIYLDATVPADGQRAWDLIPAEGRMRFVASTLDGYLVQPAPELSAIDPRAVPHPIATLLQPLDAPTETLSMPRTFAVAAQSSAFQYVYDQLSNDPGWECRALACGHDFVREADEAVTDLILERLMASRTA